LGARLNRNLRIRRRTFLATVGSGIAAGTAYAQSHPLVVVDSDGGFTVSNGAKEWRVSGEVLRRSWGVDTQPVLRPTVDGGVIVSLKDASAVGGPALLELRISPLPDGRWTAQSLVELAGLGSFTGRAQNGPPDRLLTGQIASEKCAAVFGMQLAGGATVAQLDLNKDLTVSLAGPSGFLLAPGVVANGRLILCSVVFGDEAGAVGQITPWTFRNVGPLGEAGGRSLAVRPDSGTLSVVVRDGVPSVRTKAAVSLSIGDIQFRCSRASFSYRGDSSGWKIEAPLAPDEQKIKAPSGHVVVRGDGNIGLSVTGVSARIKRFDLTAALVHSALRLPLSARTTGFADLGRLDFEGNPKVRFTVGDLGGKPQTGESHLPLDLGNRPASLSLQHARLTVRRELDMFCASFRFRGVALEFRDGMVRIVRSAAAGDPCSLLVDLPPQHVQEQAFARANPQLPGRALTGRELHSVYSIDDRKELHKSLVRESKSFEDFASQYQQDYGAAFENLDRKLMKLDEAAVAAGRAPRRHALYPSAASRALEAIYVGPDGLMTPLGRQVARKIAEKRTEDFLPKLEELPLGLTEVVVGDVLRRHGWLRDRTKPDNTQKAPPQAVLQDILNEGAKRNSDLARVLHKASEDKMAVPLLLARWRTRWPADLSKGSDERGAFANLLSQRGVFADPTREQMDSLEVQLQAPYRRQLPDTAKSPVVAYASSATQLVFDLDRRLTKSAPLAWSLEALMDWGDLPLRVSKRASPMGKISSAHSQPFSGTEELEALLTRQGIEPDRSFRGRLEDIKRQAGDRKDPDETGIVLPSRLVLSPDATVTFRTPPAPKAGARRAPIWFAEMKEVPGKDFTLRAIASDDFAPEAFDPNLSPKQEQQRTPARGVQARRYSDTIFSLDDFDRHQIVALSSLYGLPVLARRSPLGTAQTSQVAPPARWLVKEGVLPTDVDEQALYAPRALPTRLLRLSAIGGSLDLRATFVPPASLRWTGTLRNGFDAFSLERWNCLIAAGREVTTEVVYKGFLYPLGFRASLVKLTERTFMPSSSDPSSTRPIAYLIQRYFIQVSNPVKSFPAPAQPFAGRGWPARTMELLTRATPDLLDPTRESSGRLHEGWSELPNGRLKSVDATGLVFWPRTALGTRGDVRFRMTVEGRPEPTSIPLLFVDNQAVHDPTTMQLLQRYYNSARNEEDPRQPTWDADRSLDHAGARRRYAEEAEPGDTTFETQRWEVRADSRQKSFVPAYSDGAIPEQSAGPDDYLVNSAMESNDQPPFYPRCHRAFIRHDTSARFSGTPQAAIPVQFIDRYLEAGLPLLTKEELGDGSDEHLEGARARILERERTRDRSKVEVMREAFFQVERIGGAPLPKLAMGDNGDRSGGVARPELNIAAIGRRGPIGVGRPMDPPPAAEHKMGDLKSSFVAESARILGIVDLASFIKTVGETASPPVLRDIVNYADEALAQVAEVVRKPLRDLIAAIEKEPRAKTAYASALSALVTLNDLINPSEQPSKKPATATEVLLAARVAAQELERIASAPLAKLNAATDGDLRKIRLKLEEKGATALKEKLGQVFALTQSGSRLVEAANMLLPGPEVRGELKRITTQLRRGANQDSVVWREITSLENDLGKLLADAGDRALKMPPETLTAAWQSYISEVVNGLPRKDSRGWIKSAEEQLEAAIRPFGKIQQPATLENIYSVWRLAQAGNAITAIETLDKDWFPWLSDWAKGVVADVCRGPSAALDKAVEELRLALMPKQLKPLDCKPEECGTARPTEELCAALWALCARLDGSQRILAQRLAEALDQFQHALADLPAGNQCDPPFIGRLRTLEAYRQSLFSALLEWVDELANKLKEDLDDQTAQVGAKAAASILEALLPEKVEGTDLQKALAEVLGPAQAAAAKDVADAYGRIQSLPAAFRKCETMAALRAQAAGSRKAIEDVQQAGQEMVGRLAVIAGLPALNVARSWAASALTQLATVLHTVVAARNEVKVTLDALDASLGLADGRSLAGLLTVPSHKGLPPGAEGLTQEMAFVQNAVTRTPATPLVDLLTLLGAWHADGAGAMLLLKGIDQRLFEALRAQALRLVDVDALRDRLNELLAGIVPTTRKLEYEWALATTDVVKVGTLATVRVPSLMLNARSIIDLRKPTEPVKASMTGKLAPFDITIDGWVTLNFSKMEFEGGTGRSFKLTTPQLTGFVPLGKLVFLSALAAYLGIQGGSTDSATEPNGPYLIPRPGGGAGLQAGYRLSFGAVQLGTVALIDVGFDAHAELPFNDDPGAIRILLSTPEKPFLICAAPYGGSGYVQLESSQSGRERLNISLQWGGAAAIAYGPLRGTGRIMTGFRIRKEASAFNLFATFVAAFEGHIACFGIAASFAVIMDYSGRKLRGTATLTYSFSLGIAKKEFSVKVNRDAGAKLGDKQSTMNFPGDEPRVIPVAGSEPRTAWMQCDVPAGMEDWRARSTRYASMPAKGRRFAR